MWQKLKELYHDPAYRFLFLLIVVLAVAVFVLITASHKGWLQGLDP